MPGVVAVASAKKPRGPTRPAPGRRSQNEPRRSRRHASQATRQAHLPVMDAPRPRRHRPVDRDACVGSRLPATPPRGCAATSLHRRHAHPPRLQQPAGDISNLEASGLRHRRRKPLASFSSRRTRFRRAPARRVPTRPSSGDAQCVPLVWRPSSSMLSTMINRVSCDVR